MLNYTLNFYKILITIFIFSISLNFFGANAYGDSESLLESYYDANQRGDVDDIMDIIDQDFYNTTTPENFTYEEYLTEIFKAFQTNNYSLSNVSVIENNEFNLVFFTVKGQVEDIESGEKLDIDNDMVALMVHRDSDLKLSWIMTHSLYEFKLLSNNINDVVMEMSIDEVDNLDLKQIFIDNGTYEPTDLDIENTDFEDGIYSSDAIEGANETWDSIAIEYWSEDNYTEAKTNISEGMTNDFRNSAEYKDIKKQAENHDEWLKDQWMSQEEVDDYNARLKKNGLDDASINDHSVRNTWIILFSLLFIVWIGIFIRRKNKKKEEMK